MINTWDSKEHQLDSANFVQKCEDEELLTILSISYQDSADIFLQTDDPRKARICQLKAEMFAARARELSMPKCSQNQVEKNKRKSDASSLP